MNRLKKTESGIGVLVIILVVAAIGVGGVVTYQYYEQLPRQQVTSEIMLDAELSPEQQEVVVAKVNARAELESLRTLVDSNLSLALEQLAGIKDGLARAYVNADAELRAELIDLEADLDTLEAELEAGSDTAAETLEDVIAAFEASIYATLDSAVETEMTTTEAPTATDDSAMEEQLVGEDMNGETNAVIETEVTGDGMSVDSTIDMQLESEDGRSRIDINSTLEAESSSVIEVQ